MGDNKVWDTEILLDNETFDYVEFSVSAWREWITKTMVALDKIEVDEIKLLVYFSIIEMMAQEYENFPTGHLQDSFSRFVLNFQSKYDFLHLADPVTLFYRLETLLAASISLDDFGDGGVYYPKTAVIRSKVLEIQERLSTLKGSEYADKRLKEHRYVDLLYRMRCRLSHEFSAPHTSFNKSATEPYYINCSRTFLSSGDIIRDQVWKLLFPVCFVKDLCLNCFENYLNYCVENHIPPHVNNGMDRFCELSWYSKQ